MSFHRRTSVILLCGLLTVGVAGCATPPPPSAPARSAAAPSSASVAVDNCGVKQDFPAAPRRVVTVKSTATEMLLALGLGSTIVGTAYQDGPVPEQWSTAAAKVPSISERMPSEEAVLTLNPDLIYAGWESAFAADAAGLRPDLAAMGVKTYVSPAACKESAYQPKKLTFDDIFGEIAEIGRIFRVKTSGLIAQQQAMLAGINRLTGSHTALWYSSGSSIPYVGAGIGAPELIMETAGLTNIAAPVKDTWTSYSWEAVVAANPDVIVLVDASWNTVAKKIGVLESNPATARLDAVKNKRYAVIPFASSEAGVRTVAAAADLARQLTNLGLK